LNPSQHFIYSLALARRPLVVTALARFQCITVLSVRPYHGWPFLSAPHHPTLSALWALVAHGLLGLIVIWPILRHSPRGRLYAALAFVGASLIDLDHVFAAGSVAFERLETLGHRPETHSLLAAVTLGLIAWGLTRRGSAGWCVFAVGSSHLLFDAAGGGTPLFAPIAGAQGIPWLLCPAGILALTAVSAAIVRGPALTLKRLSAGPPV
jgi:hypothetical protein